MDVTTPVVAVTTGIAGFMSGREYYRAKVLSFICGVSPVAAEVNADVEHPLRLTTIGRVVYFIKKGVTPD